MSTDPKAAGSQTHTVKTLSLFHSQSKIYFDQINSCYSEKAEPIANVNKIQQANWGNSIHCCYYFKRRLLENDDVKQKASRLA